MDGWPEAGFADFQETVATMVARGSLPPRDGRVFWIGSPLTHPIRAAMMTLNTTHADAVDFREVTWNQVDPANMPKNTGGFVSMADHADFGALLDAPGYGFSARLPVLIASGRPVIVIDRPLENEILWRLRPWVHYIPCAESVEALGCAARWVMENPEAAAAIGREGQAAVLPMISVDALTTWAADHMAACCDPPLETHDGSDPATAALPDVTVPVASEGTGSALA
jgi:hypothetical protein